MQQGFIKVCAATPEIRVADCESNATKIIEIFKQCEEEKVKVVVFPELCITGSTCGDLFFQNTLLLEAKKQLGRIIRETSEMDIVGLVGLPLTIEGKLYNMSAVFKSGELLGLVPKVHLANHGEALEQRYFRAGTEDMDYVSLELDGDMYRDISVGSRLLFQCENFEPFCLGVELCQDAWALMPMSSYHALAGATVIANLSASNEVTGKADYRRELIKGQSGRLVCGYIYADAGEGESTTDLVFSAQNMICENGTILKEAKRFTNERIVAELDLEKIAVERRKMSGFFDAQEEACGYEKISFCFDEIEETKLTRTFEKTPFIPSLEADRDRRCKEILTIQAMGLKKRMEHTNSKYAVLGISGGLDSTLALLVTVKTFEMLGLDKKNIITVTLPCFGTTDRTYQNALVLTKQLGTTLMEINIKEAVSLHFEQIGHDRNVHDVTYENSQARERTQVLMDLANRYNAMVIGTGDMSELALGWATYNGDHMSMYGVNASVPKTLVRYIVSYVAKTTEDKQLATALQDIVDTPVSPELLPPKEGEIAQKTEDIVGPYELHDFFLYYIVRFGFNPAKIFNMACYTFEGDYEKETIYKWLRTFYWRFFTQQFKRSCLPDGPKVGSVGLSPRGDFKMPSDACVTAWLKELDEIKKQFGFS